MGVTRPILTLTSALLLGGGIVMAFFVILSGSSYGRPENLIYFLQASSKGIVGHDVPPGGQIRWTFFSICGVDDKGHNAHCRHTTAALPFDPPRNFKTHEGIPHQFIGTHHYYLMSRFVFPFYLIAIFFAVIAFFISSLALCTRLGAYLTGLLVGTACFFQALAASLITAWTYQGRHAFRSNGQTAKLGSAAYGFTWAAFVCYFLSTVLFCLGGRVGKAGSSKRQAPRQRGRFFGRGRKNSTRSSQSRGSFIETESQRRVKDDYE